MMKNAKKKVLTVLFAAAAAFGLSAIVLLHPALHRSQANATENENTSEYVVLDVGENIEATYYFSPISGTESECDVRITNKSVATKAIIPATAEIDGKRYTVTEVLSNGFMSCPKLVRVSLPHTIKKIGNTAFANCANLTTINLANVQEIGMSAFMRCPKLETLVIPETVTTVGTRILRLGTTQVKARAASAGANWASDWNEGNGNQNVEYSSRYEEPLLLEPIYDSVVAATFDFTPLNDTECDVRISNKNVATRADIPATAAIGGKAYKVTEIASYGFSGCRKLKTVTLPESVKKINRTAFTKCTALKTVSLANVEEIGDDAFSLCSKLTELYLPETVTKIGARILRYGNTQVKAEAAAAGENWASNWNEFNKIQTVEYSSTLVENPSEELPQLLGYALAARQPRNDLYYETDGNDNIFVPKEYEDGNPILEIPESAFSFAFFDRLVVEYSEQPIAIGNYAFEFTAGNSIVINRPVDFNLLGESVFMESVVSSVVLPDSIQGLKNAMFFGCKNLRNIYFIESKEMNREQELQIVANAKVQLETEQNLEDATGIVCLPKNSVFERIGMNAFNGATAITKLHIYDTVRSVGKQVLADWNNETQHVYVHNEKRISFVDEDKPVLGWSKNWNAEFTNVIYDNEFYTITFDYNGGTGTVEAKSVKYNNAVGALPVSTHDKYVFGGWYTAGGELFTENTVYTLKGDITLSVRWKQEIHLDQQGGTGGTSEVYAYDNETMPEENLTAPEKFDKTFFGYFSGKNGTGTKYYESDGESGMKACENVIWSFNNSFNTLYAHWEQAKYNITYDLGYMVGTILPENNPENPIEITSSQTITLKDPTRKGYNFLGWYRNGQKITQLENVFNPVTVEARWQGTEWDASPDDYSSLQCKLDVTSEYSIVNFSVYAKDVTYLINVSDSVKHLYIYGGTGRKTVKGRVNIKVSHDISVKLDNITLQATGFSNAIFMNSSHTLHLYAENSALIGANGTSEYKNGTTAIICTNIELHTPINIAGGNGYYSDKEIGGIGGDGIYLNEGGKLTISSDDIRISGGNGARNVLPTQPNGFGIAVNGTKKVVYNGEFSNVILENGIAF